MSEQTINHYPFLTDSAEHKWYAFGRYYAMFPPSFPYYATEGLTDPGDMVLDPFVGRGNSLFCAMAQGRRAVGIDVNPLAYLYSAARCSFGVEQDDLLQRLAEVADAVTPKDRKTRNSFETRAWSPDVRGFLRSARRELDWRGNDVDRTLMGFVALHAQDKLSKTGLSNKLPPTIACSPDYAVRWWEDKGMNRPPDTDPIDSLADKICRRYRYGTPKFQGGQAYEGDSRKVLAEDIETARGNASDNITAVHRCERLLERPLDTALAVRIRCEKELVTCCEVRGAGQLQRSSSRRLQPS